MSDFRLWLLTAVRRGENLELTEDLLSRGGGLRFIRWHDDRIIHREKVATGCGGSRLMQIKQTPVRFANIRLDPIWWKHTKQMSWALAQHSPGPRAASAMSTSKSATTLTTAELVDWTGVPLQRLDYEPPAAIFAQGDPARIHRVQRRFEDQQLASECRLARLTPPLAGAIRQERSG